ncbi:MAG: PfkB family carbohydrate kinase, partial [Victivallaceae bacterium]
MKFLVLGSLNIDIVYQLPHIVAPGETITSYKRSIHPGGKGANQAAALARAGADTFMAGKIGADGIFLKNILDEFNVNTSMIKIDRENPSGHGLIQLAQNGENSIVLFPGTNRQIGDDEIDRVISNFT